jgi:hypothetical protein
MRETYTILLAALVAFAPVFPAVAAQTPAPELPPITVEQSANPELVGHLAKDLNITPAQAQGGAGALLGLAKSKLTADEFSKVGSALPNIDGLLKAAPAVTGGGGVLGNLGGAVGGLASLAGAFKALGLTPEMALKMAPSLLNFVKGKGAAEAAGLLGRILK